MIKAVILDIDGTLYDYKSGNKAALAALADYAGEHFGWTQEEFMQRHQRAFDTMKKRIGMGLAAVHNRMIRYQLILEQASLPLYPHALTMYNTYWDTLIRVSSPFPGEVQAVRALKEAGYTVGIGTNMTAHIQFRKLTSLGILPYTDFVVSSEEACAEKPAAALFDLCVEKAGCSAGECAFVGDSLEGDALGALRAGLVPYLFNPAGEPVKIPEEHAADITVFTEFSQLPGLISGR